MLTHGHEDHIGALPYILRDLNVPIYGTAVHAGAGARSGWKKHGLLDAADLREVAAGQHIEIGAFGVEFIHVTHSTIDCVALAMRTPLGVIMHTGDYKMDPTPIDGQPFDLHAFARYGKEGVLALFSDSTNTERPGYTPSERAVWNRIEELCRAAPRKVLVSCFASSIQRIQQVVDIAAGSDGRSALSAAAWWTTWRLRTGWDGCAFPTAWSSGRRTSSPSIRKKPWCW